MRRMRGRENMQLLCDAEVNINGTMIVIGEGDGEMSMRNTAVGITLPSRPSSAGTSGPATPFTWRMPAASANEKTLMTLMIDI